MLTKCSSTSGGISSAGLLLGISSGRNGMISSKRKHLKNLWMAKSK
jgi:hypothetical protein